jgi:hypothetical protein
VVIYKVQGKDVKEHDCQSGKKKERDLLVTELEKTIIPEPVWIASGMRKELRDELKQDDAALKNFRKAQNGRLT